MAARQPRFNQAVLIDTTPLPESIPKVEEVGASSAPLMSASYFIGARCKAYNDDYMMCKTEAHGRGEFECMKEGRKVTRCAASVIDDITKNCLQEFRNHWECLEDNNQQLWQCRKWEWNLNGCVFQKLGLEKKIPGAPEHETPVHLRRRQIYSQNEKGVIT
ncbi:MAG: hypothetical protein L6R36_002137 [Xanthoria steineri]|nr:MAG: hypothetical protein L6R36_002137 [Xanthoria steineri]KAI4239389.1 MAG: hypothetical protein LQ349_000410 [Xanthoria aureola]